MMYNSGILNEGLKMKKLLNGEIPLAIAFWGYGVVGTIVIALLIEMIIPTKTFLAMLIFTVYVTIVWIGIWKSSSQNNKYQLIVRIISAIMIFLAAGSFYGKWFL